MQSSSLTATSKRTAAQPWQGWKRVPPRGREKIRHRNKQTNTQSRPVMTFTCDKWHVPHINAQTDKHTNNECNQWDDVSELANVIKPVSPLLWRRRSLARRQLANEKPGRSASYSCDRHEDADRSLPMVSSEHGHSRCDPGHGCG